jgi:hypothetical protein
MSGPARRCERWGSRPVAAGGWSQDDELDERGKQELVSLGLIGMIDPPRAEARRRPWPARRPPAFAL